MNRRLSERISMPVDYELPENRVPQPPSRPSRVEALAMIGIWCMAAAVVIVAVALVMEWL